MMKYNEISVDGHFYLDEKCGSNCGWDLVYSARFGIKDFPCQHIALHSDPKITDIFLPNNLNFGKTLIFNKKGIPNWKFSSKNEVVLNKVSEITPEDNGSDERSFILETAKIVFENGSKSFNHRELIYEITRLWIIKTIHLPDECKNNVEFRSEFRLKIFQQYFGDKI